MRELYALKDGISEEGARQIVDIISKDYDTFVDIMMVEELGMMPPDPGNKFFFFPYILFEVLFDVCFADNLILFLSNKFRWFSCKEWTGYVSRLYCVWNNSFVGLHWRSDQKRRSNCQSEFGRSLWSCNCVNWIINVLSWVFYIVFFAFEFAIFQIYFLFTLCFFLFFFAFTLFAIVHWRRNSLLILGGKLVHLRFSTVQLQLFLAMLLPWLWKKHLELR